MAVYTHISDVQREEILSHYNLGRSVSCVPIQEGVENSNYLLTCESQSVQERYIVTLFEKRVLPEDVLYFMDLMMHLEEQGVPSPLPQKTVPGALNLRDNENSTGKPVAITSFLRGKSSKAICEAQLFSLGQHAAKIHSSSLPRALNRQNNVGFAQWPKMLEVIEGRAREVIPEHLSMASQVCAYLGKYWPDNDMLPRGVIHADLFPDNVFFEDEGAGNSVSGIIDWYFACTDFYAYELAIIINAWCFDHTGAINQSWLGALLEGYVSVRILSDQEKDALPVLCLGAALRFWLTRAHDMIHHDENALVRPKDPKEYFDRLKHFWAHLS